MLFRVASISLGLAFALGCSSDPKLDSSTPEGGFKLAESYEKDERYEEAIAQFSQVKNKHPYSTWATEAELRIGDIQFKREDYVEAQSAYQTFKELHPSHPRIDYITFRLGLSFYHQLPSTIDRDLSLADKALLYLDELMSSYPKSEHVPQAQEYRGKILRMLADKEMYIANFYFIRKKYDSALGRFEDLLQKYPASRNTPQALMKAAISAHRLKDQARARGFLAKLQAQFADSKELREAKEELGDAQ